LAQNGTQPSELTPTKRRAIVALLAERDTRSAAKAAKVPERTMWRWLAEPAFRQELRQAEGEAIDEVTRRLIGLQGKALDTLEMTIDTLTPLQEGARVRAALGLGTLLLKLRELRNVEERLTALEAAVASQA
jgi:hypothetical protein